MSITSWIGRHVDILIIAALFTFILIVQWRIRARSAHLCECGHRRIQHDDEWGDDCRVCPCTGFKRKLFHHEEGCPCEGCTMLDATSQRRPITRKDNGDRIDE